MIPLSWVISGALVAGAFGAGYMLEKTIRDSADDKRIAAEAIAERDRIYAQAAETRLQAEAGNKAASELEAYRLLLEQQSAKAQKTRRQALQKPAECHGTLGDVVIPDAALVGLRINSGDRASEASSAASEPDL